jgi:hypothetical protein
MRGTYFLVIFVVLLLVLSLYLASESYFRENAKSASPNVFVGVDAAFYGVGDVEKLVDEVKSYTNFFVIGANIITGNVTELNEVCQYANDSGLYFAPFMHLTEDYNQSQWASYARQTWGNRFWGPFVYDETGGNQIDRGHVGNLSFMLAPAADNYTDAANKYVANLNSNLSAFGFPDVPLMTSDYALHEFDYRGGYDVVLAEFGYNLSRSLQIALCRGAATMHNKDWGVIITWTYNLPPYLENGKQLYDDMVFAYQNGAKYIFVFDYASNGNYTYDILQKEHLEALKQFWQYIQNNPRKSDTTSDRVAYVLPKDYGYGFRGLNDTIWGLWPADNLSNNIWNEANNLVEKYKPKMDIIYEDNLQFTTFRYNKLTFWNGTELINDAADLEHFKFSYEINS